MAQPYVGIKGVTSQTEVESILSSAPDMRHAVMVGILMNEDILAGKPVQHPKRYPDISRLNEIFIGHPRALNLVCYQTKAPDSLYDQLCEIRERTGSRLHGFQLDLPEPPILVMDRIRQDWPQAKFSLRINREMFRRSGHRPDVLANAVKEVSDLIDYAFVDFTNGNGVPCSPDLLRSLLYGLKQAEVPLRLGIGGGLGVYTLSPLKSLLRESPDLCLDADFSLRDEEDRLDMKAVAEFLNKAARLLAAD